MMIFWWNRKNKKTVLKHSAPYPEGSGMRFYCTVFRLPPTYIA